MLPRSHFSALLFHHGIFADAPLAPRTQPAPWKLTFEMCWQLTIKTTPRRSWRVEYPLYKLPPVQIGPPDSDRPPRAARSAPLLYVGQISLGIHHQNSPPPPRRAARAAAGPQPWTLDPQPGNLSPEHSTLNPRVQPAPPLGETHAVAAPPYVSSGRCGLYVRTGGQTGIKLGYNRTFNTKKQVFLGN